MTKEPLIKGNITLGILWDVGRGAGMDLSAREWLVGTLEWGVGVDRFAIARLLRGLFVDRLSGWDPGLDRLAPAMTVGDPELAQVWIGWPLPG